VAGAASPWPEPSASIGPLAVLDVLTAALDGD
jgi:hypothetical protein